MAHEGSCRVAAMRLPTMLWAGLAARRSPLPTMPYELPQEARGSLMQQNTAVVAEAVELGAPAAKEAVPAAFRSAARPEMGGAPSVGAPLPPPLPAAAAEDAVQASL